VFWYELRSDLVICQSHNPVGLSTKSDLFFMSLNVQQTSRTSLVCAKCGRDIANLNGPARWPRCLTSYQKRGSHRRHRPRLCLDTQQNLVNNVVILLAFFSFVLYIFLFIVLCVFVFYNHCCLVRINKWMDGLTQARTRLITSSLSHYLKVSFSTSEFL